MSQTKIARRTFHSSGVRRHGAGRCFDRVEDASALTTFGPTPAARAIAAEGR